MMLPINPNQGGECEAEERGAQCFAAGEGMDEWMDGSNKIHGFFG